VCAGLSARAGAEDAGLPPLHLRVAGGGDPPHRSGPGGGGLAGGDHYSAVSGEGSGRSRPSAPVMLQIDGCRSVGYRCVANCTGLGPPVQDPQPL
jgi:hypothetical protein